MQHFSDRLMTAVNTCGSCAVVGIDPVWERLPESVRPSKTTAELGPEAAAKVIQGFCSELIQLAAGQAAGVKLNIAFFEQFYWWGVRTYYELVAQAQKLGLLVIGDVKRGDIGSTATAYAVGHVQTPGKTLAGIGIPDAITINGFAGTDGIEPFAKSAVANGRGIFVWVRASNPSAGELQDRPDTEGKTFSQRLAEQTARIGADKNAIGDCGLSDIGMVVGGTAGEQARQLRQAYPQTIFLVPGYGAQGATAADCLAGAREDGTGVLVNASRSIICAHQRPEYAKKFGADWKKCVRQALADMKADLK
ncbi:MAG: orotidine-5'-phosphate decarboxylase [Sedimentisphaerales bacterium]|nr:orotidine-5'-phosphate decarboxylase [Sedimentisphaerales bacterium]